MVKHMLLNLIHLNFIMSTLEALNFLNNNKNRKKFQINSNQLLQ
jgi:hypothetical protein